jgi:hypothetical protein
LREFHAHGKIGCELILAGMDIVERINAAAIGAGGEAIVLGAQLQFDIWERIFGVVGRREHRRIRAAQDAEDGSYLVAVAHGAQLRNYRAPFGGRASAAANRCEEAAVVRFVGKYEILLALLEVEGAVAIFAARKYVDLGRIFSSEPFVDSKMETNDCRSCGRVWVLRNIFGGRDSTDERDIILLQARTHSRRHFRASAGSCYRGSDEKQQQQHNNSASNHPTYPTSWCSLKSRGDWKFFVTGCPAFGFSLERLSVQGRQR